MNLNAISETKFVVPIHPSKAPPQINRATPINLPVWKYCRPRPEKKGTVRQNRISFPTIISGFVFAKEKVGEPYRDTPRVLLAKKVER